VLTCARIFWVRRLSRWRYCRILHSRLITFSRPSVQPLVESAQGVNSLNGDVAVFFNRGRLYLNAGSVKNCKSCLLSLNCSMVMIPPLLLAMADTCALVIWQTLLEDNAIFIRCALVVSQSHRRHPSSSSDQSHLTLCRQGE
jgi:hypothetical protein